jgi:hypothetical protein
MRTLHTADKQVAWTNADTITEADLPEGMPFHPARRIIGTRVDWTAEPIQRMRGDDFFYPGTMPGGRPVRISRSLAYYFPEE